MNKLVLEITYAGLGDHLFFTPIPRLAKELKIYDQVFISNYSRFRDPSYKRLIWELNPFIDGFIDQHGTNNIKRFSELDVALRKDKSLNLLDAIVGYYNLDDGNRQRQPEIYYSPKHLSHLEDVSVYDPNFITNVGKLSTYGINKYLKKIGVEINYQLSPRGHRSLILPDVDAFISTRSIEEYCDIIHSCRTFYCLASGGATLAAALNKPSTVFYSYGLLAKFRHHKLHRYIRCMDIFSYRLLARRTSGALVRMASPKLYKALRAVVRIVDNIISKSNLAN